jgi:hypothetical protein
LNQRAVLATFTLVAALSGCRSEGVSTGTAPVETGARGDATASAQPAHEASGPLPVDITGGEYPLRGEILIPAGRGPFPAVVYNHGSEREPSLRWMGETARWLQAQGYVALFPYRRGTIGSEGPYWEAEVEGAPEAERDRAMVSAFERELADVMTAVEWLDQPLAKAPRIQERICVSLY